MKAIDCVGVIIQVNEKEQINLKSGATKTRKYIQIVDDTNCSIALTMWGDNLCERQNGL
jgi:hypothetical protein